MILITGASSGLGAALAKIYDSQGEEVILTGRNAQKLSGVVEELSPSAVFEVCDLSDHRSVEGLFDRLDTCPKTLIHCAGSGYFGRLEEQEPEVIQNMIQNNLSTAINVVRESVKRYQERPLNLIMVMSTAAQQPKAEESTYCAVKWAVKGLIESVRLELKGKPMKIIAIYPGGMSTDFWPTSGKSMDTSGFMSAADAAHMISTAITSVGHGFVSDITVNRS